MKVYIAGPYTIGDVAQNVRNAVEAGDQVLKLGHIPFIPHMAHFWHLLFPGPYEQWLQWDLSWLESCDALIRLPGQSPGADREVAAAKKIGMAIFDGVKDFADFSRHYDPARGIARSRAKIIGCIHDDH